MNWTVQNAVLFATALQAGLAQLGSRFSKRIKRRVTIVVIVAVTVMAGQTVSAQITSSGQQAPPSLKTVSVPGPDDSELAKYIRDKTSAIAFLKSLTDERVRDEKAPFDHPQIFVPNGQPGNQNSVANDGKGQATDDLLEIPPVGRSGRNIPGVNFLEQQQ